MIAIAGKRRLAVWSLFLVLPCIPKFESHLGLYGECDRDPSLGTEVVFRYR